MTTSSARSRVHLRREMFSEKPHTVVEHDGIQVDAHRYASGVEALTIRTPRGHVIVLPYLGQIVWDAVFDGTSMTMDSMFAEPRPAANIVDTYGCFAFHSGLLSAGCPGPEDDHEMHGEFACAELQEAWLELDHESVSVCGSLEWVKGFGDHYLATPRVTCTATKPAVTIEMSVTNLSRSRAMPLQYMCHLNHAYQPNATFGGDIPTVAFKLRESVPEHVHPTPAWRAFTDAILRGEEHIDALTQPQHYDPEIVLFADNVADYGERLCVTCGPAHGSGFFTEFSSREFPVVTRWLLHNADQQVAAFCLPGTSRPEGFSAAKEADTLIYLQPGETRRFSVTTGVNA